MLRNLGIISLFAMSLSIAHAEQTSVDLELVLAVDVSHSMDEEEQKIQRQGYILAFRNPEILEAIRTGIYGKIAVIYLEWSNPTEQFVVAPWTEIKDATSAENFAATLERMPILHLRDTSISEALVYAESLFVNEFDGMRRVIDISGDGANNVGLPITPVRDSIVGKGIVINGLPLMLRPTIIVDDPSVTLDVYYRDCVIGGPGSFFIPVMNSGEFENAIRRKLILEIAGRNPIPLNYARDDGIPPVSLVVETLAPLRLPTNCSIGRKERLWQVPFFFDR